MPSQNLFDLIRTQVWINFLLSDLKISADELELILHPYRAQPTRTVARWAKGESVANKTSVRLINAKYPQAKKIYELSIWDLMDCRRKTFNALCSSKTQSKILVDKATESYEGKEFLGALYALREAEFRGRDYIHYKQMEHCLRMFPYYFSKEIFKAYIRDLATLLYRCAHSMPSTESRIRPDYESICRYTEYIDLYDHTQPECTFELLMDFDKPFYRRRH